MTCIPSCAVLFAQGSQGILEGRAITTIHCVLPSRPRPVHDSSIRRSRDRRFDIAYSFGNSRPF